LLAPFARS